MPDDSFQSRIVQKVDELETGSSNYIKEAFQWQYNVIGLAGAAAFALISGTALPVLLAAGIELMYLAVVPQSSAFRRLVRSWRYEDEKKAHDAKVRAMQQQLPADVRERFAKLGQLAQNIRSNYTRLSSTSQIFVDQVYQRIDALMNSFLRLASAESTYTEYLQRTNPRAIDQEIISLERNLEKQPPKVQEINRKRIEIMRKRQERFKKIVEDLQVIQVQCAAIEDVLALIRDQSISLTDPQQVNEKLDLLMQDVESTEATVREIEDFFLISSPEMTTTIPPLPTGASGEGTSSRDRNRHAN
jgi:hypothetical protein